MNIGDEHGNSIGDTIGNTIGNSIANSIGDTIGNTIGNTIDNSKGSSIHTIRICWFCLFLIYTGMLESFWKEWIVRN